MSSLRTKSCIRYINEFSISMSELSTHLDMMECYIDSAGTLHGVAIDGLIQNKSGRIGSQSDETYQQKIMIAFCLLRHALELGIKALITTMLARGHQCDYGSQQKSDFLFRLSATGGTFGGIFLLNIKIII